MRVLLLYTIVLTAALLPAVDMKSFLFSNNLISDHQFCFRQVTLPWTCCLYSSNNGWRPSMSDLNSGPFLWKYLMLLIQSGILPYSSNSLPTASKANSTHGLLASTLIANMWLSAEHFHLLSLSVKAGVSQGSVQSYF